jgi:hypothetical protein
MLKLLFMELNEVCFEKMGNGFHLGIRYNQTVYMRCPKFQVTNIFCHTNQIPEAGDYREGIERLINQTWAWYTHQRCHALFSNKPLRDFCFGRDNVSHKTNNACLKLVQAMHSKMSDFYFQSLGLDIESDVYLLQGKKAFAFLWPCQICSNRPLR